MTSGRIVELLNIVEHIYLGLVPGSIVLERRAFGFERGEEALHRRVVPDVAGSAHAAYDAVVSRQPPELLSAVLAPLVGVVQQCVWLATASDRH